MNKAKIKANPKRKSALEKENESLRNRIERVKQINKDQLSKITEQYLLRARIEELEKEVASLRPAENG